MIIYNTRNWGESIWKILLSLHWGNNYRILLRYILFMGAYTSGVTYLTLNHTQIVFSVEPFFFSLLGLILSLFLVFRLNSSYNKWWEGRQLWGNLINHSRTLSAYLAGLLPKDDTVTRRFFAVQISNFAYALKGHLRNDIQLHNFDTADENYLKTLGASQNVPHEIARMIFQRVEKLYREGTASDIDKANMKVDIGAFLNIMGSCERIRNTPIPFSHSSFFKSFILIYLLSLPFGFVNVFHYFTIPATLLISYALLGIEVISEEIEEPFGKDPNDLPTTFLSGVIRRDIYSILGVENTMPEIVEPVRGSSQFKMIH